MSVMTLALPANKWLRPQGDERLNAVIDRVDCRNLVGHDPTTSRIAAADRWPTSYPSDRKVGFTSGSPIGGARPTPPVTKGCKYSARHCPIDQSRTRPVIALIMMSLNSFPVQPLYTWKQRYSTNNPQ